MDVVGAESDLFVRGFCVCGARFFGSQRSVFRFWHSVLLRTAPFIVSAERTAVMNAGTVCSDRVPEQTTRESRSLFFVVPQKAAIHEEGGAGDVGGIVGAQKRGERGYVRGL